MAKKKATKKVAKIAAPASVEEKLVAEANSLTDEEAEAIVDVGSGLEPPKTVIDDVNPMEKKMMDDIRIRLNVRLKVARKEYMPGEHTIKRHQLPVFREMLSKKMKSDLSMFTGKNYIIERLLDRTLVIKETSKLDVANIG